MTFGIIRERKIPLDARVALTPEQCAFIQKSFPEVRIIVESSESRCFSDEAYLTEGVEISTNLSHCDILLGIKEVPIEQLNDDKTYFFFSHTIKKQVHNRKLLQAILEKNIELYDHETIVDVENRRLIGFGRYAGIVGAYNGFRAFGIKYD